MEVIESFTGVSQIACRNQLLRARGPAQTIADILLLDGLALNNEPLTEHMSDIFYGGCGCKISENGCIDPSECRISHKLYRIPTINRWCDATTSHMRGAGALLLWSGWARPSAMKLLGRHPTVDQVTHLISNSHPRTLHTSWRYQFSLRHDPQLQTNVLDISSNKNRGERAKTYLRTINPAVRFGQHNIPSLEAESV